MSYTWAWVDADTYHGDKQRVWLEIKFPEHINPSACKREHLDEARAWGKKAVSTWVECMKDHVRSQDRDLRNLSATSALEAFEAALHDSRMKPFIKNKGTSHTKWVEKNIPEREQDGVKEAKSAVGIPDREYKGEITELPIGKLVDYVQQRHEAERAGTHYDVRFGDKGLHSWATRKELPEPGEKRTLFRQPMHSQDYKDFQGDIPEGYGKGKVETADKGKIIVTKAEPGKISFVLAHKKYPENYTLIKQQGPNDPWLMVNTTPTDPEKFLGDASAFSKLQLKKVPAADVSQFFNHVLEGKMNGAAALFRLNKNSVDVLSHRISATGRPIIHTNRFFAGASPEMNIPDEHVGKILRGELYGEKEGKAVRPQQLTPLLNSSVARSIEQQSETGIKLKAAIYGIHGEPKRNIALIKEILKHLPADRFGEPPRAETPEAAAKLWEDIKSGQHPATDEGVVAYSHEGEPLAKIPVRPTFKVQIRKFFPAEPGSKYEGRAVGGFEYSHPGEDKIVGRVGTGIDDRLRELMHTNPEDFLNRQAEIEAESKLESGAYFKPSLREIDDSDPAELKKSAAHVHRRYKECGHVQSCRCSGPKETVDVDGLCWKCEHPELFEKSAHIKEEGGEFVLYTSDGSRVLGRHPSRDKAMAQERAIKASEHAKSASAMAPSKTPGTGPGTGVPKQIPPKNTGVTTPQVSAPTAPATTIAPKTAPGAAQPPPNIQKSLVASPQHEAAAQLPEHIEPPLFVQPGYDVHGNRMRSRLGGMIDTGDFSGGALHGSTQSIAGVAKMAHALAPGEDVLDQLLAAKEYSDLGDYKKKAAIMSVLMHTRPDEFKVTDDKSHHWGVEHTPTSFKMHVPRNIVPAAVHTRKKAVVITGNPKLINSKDAKAFYKAIMDTLDQAGYDVTTDPGEPHTEPPTADLWVGHSRGAERLQYAPKGTRTIALGSNREGAINHPNDNAFEAGQVPGAAHFTLTDEMRDALLSEPKS